MTIDTEFNNVSEAFDVNIKELYVLTPEVDQSFKPESANAQSGTAVAEAIKDFVDSGSVASGFQTLEAEINKKAERTELITLKNNIIEDVNSLEDDVNILRHEMDSANGLLKNSVAFRSEVQTLESKVNQNADTANEKLDGKMDKFGNYEESENAIYVESPFYIRSAGGYLDFYENSGVALATNEDNVTLHANNVNLELTQEGVNLRDASTYPEKPMNLTGVKTPDGTDTTAAVNVEYVNGIVGDINAVLKKLVEVEE